MYLLISLWSVIDGGTQMVTDWKFIFYFFISSKIILFFYEVSMTAGLNLQQICPDWILLKFIQWPPFPTKIDTFIFLRKLVNTSETVDLIALMAEINLYIWNKFM